MFDNVQQKVKKVLRKVLTTWFDYVKLFASRKEDEMSIKETGPCEVMKYSRLRGRIVEKYGTQDKFGEILGISNTSLSKKMTGKSGFSQSDILKWCALLDIDLNDIGAYFYT